MALFLTTLFKYCTTSGWSGVAGVGAGGGAYECKCTRIKTSLDYT